MRILAFTLTCLLAHSAHAGIILAFDGTRCHAGGHQYWLTGNGMTGPRSQLAMAGHSVVTTNLITPQALAGALVFVSGLPRAGEFLPQSEVDALTQWIQAGGSALLFGDNTSFTATNSQFAQICGVTYLGAPTGTTVSFVAPTHPVAHGPAGNVSSVGWVSFPGAWTNHSPNAITVAENPDGTAAIVAATVGQGRVLLINDQNLFAHPPSYGPDNPILWDNAIAWLIGPSIAGRVYCSGDGTAADCPCGNFSTLGEGCAHSFGVGAWLTGAGFASVISDSAVLLGSRMPNSSALYFQGTQRAQAGMGIVFGDGLRCVGGNITRLGTKQNSAGASSYPEAGDPPISVRGHVSPGEVRQYQVWYRNSAAFCTPNGFNLSNGYEITWGF